MVEFRFGGSGGWNTQSMLHQQRVVLVLGFA